MSKTPRTLTLNKQDELYNNLKSITSLMQELDIKIVILPNGRKYLLHDGQRYMFDISNSDLGTQEGFTFPFTDVEQARLIYDNPEYLKILQEELEQSRAKETAKIAAAQRRRAEKEKAERLSAYKSLKKEFEPEK